jgi:hypothetical protein
LFILEDLFDGVVVEGDDLCVDIEDNDKGQDNIFVHWFNIKIYKIIDTRGALTACDADNSN